MRRNRSSQSLPSLKNHRSPNSPSLSSAPLSASHSHHLDFFSPLDNTSAVVKTALETDSSFWKRIFRYDKLTSYNQLRDIYRLKRVERYSEYGMYLSGLNQFNVDWKSHWKAFIHHFKHKKLLLLYMIQDLFTDLTLLIVYVIEAYFGSTYHENLVVTSLSPRWLFIYRPVEIYIILVVFSGYNVLSLIVKFIVVRST